MFLTILLLFFSLGQLERISLFGGQINFYFYEILSAGFFLYLVKKLKLSPLEKSYKNFKWIFLFIFGLLFSLLLSFYKFSFFQNIVATLYFIRITFYLLFFIYLTAFYSLNLKKDYPKSILVFSLVTLTISYIQYFFYPNLRNLYYLGWDPHQYRVFGFFFEPAIAASIFGLLLIYFFQVKNNLDLKFKKVFIVLYSILGLLTYSRGFYAAFVFTSIIFLVKRNLYKQIFAFLIVFLLSIILLPKPFGEGVNLSRIVTVQSRLANYQKAITIWKENPIFGIGYNHLSYVKTVEKRNKAIPDHSGSAFHSSFFTILTTGGVLGLLLFIFLLINMGRVSETASYYVIFLSIFSLTDNIILHPFVLFLFLYLMVKETSLSRKLR